MKENNILGQDVSSILSISIGKDTRGVHLLWSNCHQQNILRCPTQLNILLKSQLGWHSFLWWCERPMLTINTKVMVYQACLLSLLLYGNETWILNTRQKHCLSSLYIHFSTASVPAWPCQPNGRLLFPGGPVVWWACHWHQTFLQTYPGLHTKDVCKCEMKAGTVAQQQTRTIMLEASCQGRH